MVHQCMIKLVVMWLHVLVVSLFMCVCRTVREKTTPEQCDIVFKTIACAFVGE